VIVRADGLVVSQLAHSALAGRLAEAWALDGFPEADALRVAATIHDLGWSAWETAPQLNPETGAPYTFFQVPDPGYLDIWARGTDEAMGYGRVAGLLVSMHCTRLLSRRPGEGAAALVERERARQATLLDGVPRAQEMSDLIARWDGMSLTLCGGKELELEDWPFAADRVELAVDARELGGPYASQAELDAAFAAAPWRTLHWTLRA
jgi:hypothetical protein